MGYAEYRYRGPVFAFDTCVNDDWSGTTYAVSEKKARSNLAYQYKRETDRIAETRITLPGKITRVGKEE